MGFRNCCIFPFEEGMISHDMNWPPRMVVFLVLFSLFPFLHLTFTSNALHIYACYWICISQKYLQTGTGTLTKRST